VKRSRVAAALLLVLGTAPGTLVRTSTPIENAGPLLAEPLTIPQSAEQSGVVAEALWEIEARGIGFGGFSALLSSDDGLRAFSDRGWTLAFDDPSRPRPQFRLHEIGVEPGYGLRFFDIESAVSAPRGEYWLGFENHHGLQRFTAAGIPDGVRDLEKEVNWAANAGAEGMLRMPDGRFVLFPEWADEGLIFSGDPVEGARWQTFELDWPVRDHGVTDAALLPDGRVLVLLRAVDMTLPPKFRTVLAIGEGGAIEPGARWSPEVLANLDAILPSENFEGMAVEARRDGPPAIWLVSDDNFSAFQRTLLARISLRDAHEKAREEP